MEASKVLIYLIMIRYAYVKGGKTLEDIFFFISSSSNDRKIVFFVYTITFLVLFWKIGRKEICNYIDKLCSTFFVSTKYSTQITHIQSNYPFFFR